MDEYAYIGIKDGTVRAITMDEPAYAKDTAKMVAAWIKEGRTVERVKWEDGIARMKCGRLSVSSGERQ